MQISDALIIRHPSISQSESHAPRPSYLRVFLTFVRNSLVRDMMFPANFIIETISSFAWVMMNWAFTC